MRGFLAGACAALVALAGAAATAARTKPVHAATARFAWEEIKVGNDMLSSKGRGVVDVRLDANLGRDAAAARG